MRRSGGTIIELVAHSIPGHVFGTPSRARSPSPESGCRTPAGLRASAGPRCQRRFWPKLFLPGGTLALPFPRLHRPIRRPLHRCLGMGDLTGVERGPEAISSSPTTPSLFGTTSTVAATPRVFGVTSAADATPGLSGAAPSAACMPCQASQQQVTRARDGSQTFSKVLLRVLWPCFCLMECQHQVMAWAVDLLDRCN